MSCFVYMLECVDGSFYTGWTKDLDSRVTRHNKGRGGRYTRSRLPVRLVYWEEQPDSSSAMRREAAIKRWTRTRKLAMVAEFGIE